jgi:hypothetical protein
VKQGYFDARQVVLRYLAKNPDAKGTVESIAEWWILEQRIEDCLEAVQDALSDLVTAGFLLEERRPNRPVMYQLNRQRLKDVEDFLERS